MSRMPFTQSTSVQGLVRSRHNSRQRKHARLHHRHLQAERLEDRRLLAGNPLSSIPALHSNPGAAASIYLDFNGHFEPVYSSYTNVTTLAYDIDGDAQSFSETELAYIRTIWETLSEDFVPFNIDVTTVEPPALAPGTPIANANKVALRVAIGADVGDWAGSNSGYGILNAFTNSYANVAYVFPTATYYEPFYIVQVAAWEAGRSFGLFGQNWPISQGQARPLMGTVMIPDPGVSTWSNGTNGVSYITGDFQDDMAILASTANGFGYRRDDHGNTTASATPLTKVGSTSWTGAGIVGTNSDMDVFSLVVTTSDTYRIAANVAAVSPNLDAVLELRDSAGTLIATADPPTAFKIFGPRANQDAAIVEGLSPGSYYLSVKSTGVYGWIGQYTVNIDNSPLAGIIVTPATGTAKMTTGEDGRQTTFSVVLQTQPTADVTIPLSSTNPAEGTLSALNLVFTAANWDIPQIVTVTGVDDTIVGNDTSYSVVIGPANTTDLDYSGRDPADLPMVNVDNDDAGFVYRTDSGTDTIERSRLGGSQSETLVSLKPYLGSMDAFTPRSIVVDSVAGKMYWTDSSSRKIQRANLDGSSVETVIAPATGTFYSLILDTVRGKMYWNNGQAIQQANLDGSGIIDIVTGVYSSDDMVLDTEAGKLYWTNGNTANGGTIFFADLDGTDTGTFWTVTAPTYVTAIALDPSGQKLYWSTYSSGRARMYQQSLGGTDATEIVLDTAAYTDKPDASGRYSLFRELAIDGPAGKMYWTDEVTKSVYRANLDGSVVANIGAVQGYYGLAIVHPGPAISVTHGTGLITSESGGSDVFRVALTTQPTADVTVGISSSDTTEGTVSTSSLLFTPANWNVSQTVSVTGVNDTIIDGDVAYAIVLAAAASSDLNYQGINPVDVSVTNTDNDTLPTKFYVVNDASLDQTYEYNTSGGSIEKYSLNVANTAPRGAASTIAGDKTWVVDANRKVYVYNASGGLLGSWTADSFLSNSSNVQGIATNGTDVWIVDVWAGWVVKYAGAAATSTSGTQYASSRFSLNSGNTNPTDIVTDGTYFWVVDDGKKTDKVFKYTLSGSYVGSWTISSGGGSPTGITLDPAHVSNLWIVDSATDRVYQYDAAAGRKSGSQAPSTSFALAAGNTNPQGIADPPPPSSELVLDATAVGDSDSTTSRAAAYGTQFSVPASLGSQASHRLSDPQRSALASRSIDQFMSRLEIESGTARTATRAAWETTPRTRRLGVQRSDVSFEPWSDDLDAAIDSIVDDRVAAME